MKSIVNLIVQNEAIMNGLTQEEEDESNTIELEDKAKYIILPFFFFNILIQIPRCSNNFTTIKKATKTARKNLLHLIKMIILV
jgi:hypothetical protein